jgi:hypothetical protein
VNSVSFYLTAAASVGGDPSVGVVSSVLVGDGEEERVLDEEVEYEDMEEAVGDESVIDITSPAAPATQSALVGPPIQWGP